MDVKVYFSVKIVIVGDSGIGKTVFLRCYTEPEFFFRPGNEGPTYGTNFNIKNLTWNDKDVRLEVWDTAGQERYNAITRNLYHNAHGVVIMYDVTDPKSFAAIPQWMERINEVIESPKTVLVGNKVDMEQERKVTEEEGRTLAERLNIPFFETSVKEDLNVAEACYCLVDLIMTENKIKGVELGEQSPEEPSKEVQTPRRPRKPSESEFKCCS